MIIAMVGLPGTGKTTLAQALAQSLADRRAVILSKDTVRAALFSAEDIEYSSDQDDLCVRITYEVAAHLLRRSPGRPIIFDGRTYSRAGQLSGLDQLAREASVPLFLIHCICSDETAVKRILADVSSATHVAANRTPDLYWKLQTAADPLERERIVVNTDKSTIAEDVAEIRRQLEM